MLECDLRDAGGSQRQVEGVLHVGMGHPRTQFPAEDVTREVVNDRGEIIVAPANDLELSKPLPPKGGSIGGD
jgi:hypothetical protein